MTINKEEFQKAYYIWSDFKNEVLYKNRFIINHEVLDIIKSISVRNTREINTGQTFYRARLFDVDETLLSFITMQKSTTKNSPFHGYDAEGSFIPRNNDVVSDGRANPSFIKYLYTAEDAYVTARI
ncbi:hypothetical protein EXW96_02235 [Paenibacillus sp. JMULE4]|uniref:hypothetical protein n=1 Tax=Paenibacillus sp. JMULE4 TaxID=2518342 RepID=UPI001576F565|nr:hypothetical protein [Paenibacillus sp. JMULE4]NTZ16433.1 hypothetical protein [Paenibacillus sp. JMULE4]